MATKQVMAYFMHEHEQAAAEAAMPTAESTPSYLVGEIDDAAIEGLRAQGLIIQELDDGKPGLASLSPALESAQAAAVAAHASKTSTLSASPSPLTATTTAVAVATTHALRLAGPLLEARRRALEDAGARIIEKIGPQRYAVDLDPSQASVVRALPFVASVEPLVDYDLAPPVPTAAVAAPAVGGLEQIATYDIRLKSKSEDGRDAVLAFLQGREAIVVASKDRKIRVVLRKDSPLLSELASLPEVYQVMEYVPPSLSNDRGRVLLGIDPAVVGGSHYPFDGTGQVVAIADTGIDEQHPDLQARFDGVVALGRNLDPSDPDGHGTHVTGSVGGNGTASNSQIRGTAPGVRFFFQSIMDAKGELGGLPLDLNDLFDEAYQAGARIHNNSWGSKTKARYPFSSLEVDEFVDGHRDMVVVIAAGNDGSARAPFNAKPGFVDWLSICSPATAKNAITVGACQTDRTSGGYAKLTWGAVWPQAFPTPPMPAEKISGKPQDMAAFSSRGPCDDRRIKPDVVAPGTDIVSAKSSRAPAANFWGPYPGHSGRYAYMGGTSMAAPIVSGCLALIRQYYVDDRKIEPSAALLKATLINSTRALSGPTAVADFPNLPNFHQGFGCVHMPWAVPNPLEPGLTLEYIDSWPDKHRHFRQPGERRRYRVTAGAGRELRFCLAYTDIPARALQNDLNLLIEQPGGAKIRGNESRPMKIGEFDADNNVEIVRIETPQAGDYLIQITASNLLGSSQDFALVATGDLKSGITFVSN